ncbi:hypothetical protein PHYC_03219 [Phycisphaerales bacterium]|nr:hypothetical protein PHYC_03219 [Phycisphaerales bacterium]
MPVIGTNIAASVAGVTSAERAAGKPAPRKEPAKGPGRRPSSDELIVSADAAEAPEGIRSLKGNDQEEAHEDRDQHETYTPGGRPKDAPRPRLDVAG